jgi:hypothetical protein
MKHISRRENSSLTMTVLELKNYLSKFPENMPIVATWEGVSAAICDNNFSVHEIDQYYPEKTLEIDVESYG